MSPSEEGSRRRKRLREWVGIGVFSAVAVVTVAFAILIVGSMFIACASSLKNIGVACVRLQQGQAFRCEMTSGETGIDFSRLEARVVDSTNTELAAWHAPIRFDTSGRAPVAERAPPISSDSFAIDRAPAGFGIGDGFVIDSTGAVLAGLTFKIWAPGNSGERCGSGTYGSAHIG